MQQFTEHELEEARVCLEAYGEDLERWPADARAKVGALIDSDELAVSRRDAAALDQLLASSSAPATPHDLQNRIMAQFDVSAPSSRPGLADGLFGWIDRLRLAPAGALAGLSAIGFAIGVWTDSGSSPLPPEYEAYAYLDAGALGDLTDEEDELWAAE